MNQHYPGNSGPGWTPHGGAPHGAGGNYYANQQMQRPRPPGGGNSVLVVLLAIVGAAALIVGAGVFLLSGGGDNVVKRATISTFAQDYFRMNGAGVLNCFHPTGEYARVGVVSIEGPETAVGPIYWKGGILGTGYVTTVRLHFTEATTHGPVIAELVSDTAVVPSVAKSCTLEPAR